MARVGTVMRPRLSYSPEIEPELPDDSFGASLDVIAGQARGVHLEQALYSTAQVKSSLRREIPLSRCSLGTISLTGESSSCR